MSSLAFLQAGAAGNPTARSPMAADAAAAGARMASREGWEVAVAFGEPEAERRACSEAVAFADLSHLGKLEIQGEAGAIAAALGASLELGSASSAGGAWLAAVTPRRALAICPCAGTAAMRERLEAERALHVLDLTCSLAALAVVGPLAREAFARFCALDLRPAHMPVGAFRPGSAGRTPAYVLREGEQRYLLLFGAAYGSYMWSLLADVAGHLGGQPVGVEAIAAAAGETGGPADA